MKLSTISMQLLVWLSNIIVIFWTFILINCSRFIIILGHYIHENILFLELNERKCKPFRVVVVVIRIRIDKCSIFLIREKVYCLNCIQRINNLFRSFWIIDEDMSNQTFSWWHGSSNKSIRCLCVIVTSTTLSLTTLQWPRWQSLRPCHLVCRFSANSLKGIGIESVMCAIGFSCSDFFGSMWPNKSRTFH